MLDIKKLKKINPIARRMHLMNYMCEKIGQDVYYVFGLLNMYNAKNRGRWFWQKARFTGVLKDDFDNFNNYMTKFINNFRSFNDDKIMSGVSEAGELLKKLIVDLESNMMVNRDVDASNVKSYLDSNMKNMIDQNLRDS